MPSLLPGEGNVHTGAPPPWLKQGDSESSFFGNHPARATAQSPLLSITQQRKLAKLRNPKRVGAAWAEQRRAEIEKEMKGETLQSDMEASSTWLPSFGRVWQSGSRRETRKEFEAEKRSAFKKQGQQHTQNSVVGRSLEVKPYVSKRQRTSMDALEK